MGTIWCGIDWAEHHHDVALVDDDGNLVAKRRIGDDAVGFTTLLRLLAEHGATADGEHATPIAIETARGLLPAALLAAGFIVYAINPLAASRYRDRYSVSRAKSDAGDAFVLANILRTNRSAHRPIPNDSELVRAVRVLARAQQDAVWDRQQAQNKLRSLLREYYPTALNTFADLAAPVAREVLLVAPTPVHAARLRRSSLTAALTRAGRQRGIPAEVGTHLVRATRRAAASTAAGRTGHGRAGPRLPAFAVDRVRERRTVAERDGRTIRRAPRRHRDHQPAWSWTGARRTDPRRTRR